MKQPKLNLLFSEQSIVRLYCIHLRFFETQSELANLANLSSTVKIQNPLNVSTFIIFLEMS